MDLLATEIIINILLHIPYENIWKIALVNKNIYSIYQELKSKEQILPINKLSQFSKFIKQGYRYLYINVKVSKIINITQYSPYSISFILKDGCMVNIYFTNNEIKIIHYYNKLGEEIKNLGLIIDSPFIHKCKKLTELNKNLKHITIMRD